MPSQAEAEAGTATTERVWTAERVGQAIAALAPEAGAAQIKINALRIATLEDDAFNLTEDGFADAYTTEDGVDTGASTNQSYNAPGNFYDNLIFTAAVSGNWTFGSDTITSGVYVTSGGNDGGYSSSKTFTGDFTIRFVGDGQGNPATLGMFASSESGTFNTGDTGGRGDMDLMTDSFYWDAAGDLFYGGVVKDSGADQYANTDTITITRVGSTISFYKNGILEHEFAETYAGAMMIGVGHPNSTITDFALTWNEGGASDMTLISNTVVAEAVPTEIEVLVLWKDIDAATPNTDFTVEVSRNGGTNYTTITLTDEGEFDSVNNIDILRGVADVTGQPSAQNIEYRLKTLNTKEQRVYGIALGWL